MGIRTQKRNLEKYFSTNKWKPADQPYVLYDFLELYKKETTFGHPSIKNTRSLHKSARGNATDRRTNYSIKRITLDCTTCAKRSSAPGRFKMTNGTADKRFNHEVKVDTMWISGKTVIQMVDKSTHFTVARFVRNQTSSKVGKTIRGMWNLLYCVPPDFLSIDQGINYTSTNFRESARNDGIKMKETPKNTTGDIWTVEQYQAPL